MRIEGNVRQKIVKHIGVVHDDKELEELKILAESMKQKLELENCLPLSPFNSYHYFTWCYIC